MSMVDRIVSKKNAREYTSVGVKLDKETSDKLTTLAKQHGVSKMFLIRGAINELLNGK